MTLDPHPVAPDKIYASLSSRSIQGPDSRWADSVFRRDEPHPAHRKVRSPAVRKSCVLKYGKQCHPALFIPHKHKCFQTEHKFLRYWPSHRKASHRKEHSLAFRKRSGRKVKGLRNTLHSNHFNRYSFFFEAIILPANVCNCLVT